VIVIYGIGEKLDPIRARLSDAIHLCMREVLGMPEDKRSHRFVPLRREDVYFPGGRSDSYIFLEIKMMQGRTEQTKKALIKRLFAVLEADVGLAPADVEIMIQESPPHCWGFRGMTGDEAKLNYKVNV